MTPEDVLRCREAADYVANVVERISRHAQYGWDDPEYVPPDDGSMCRPLTETQERQAMIALILLRRRAAAIDRAFASIDPVLEPLGQHDDGSWSVSIA